MRYVMLMLYEVCLERKPVCVFDKHCVQDICCMSISIRQRREVEEIYEGVDNIMQEWLYLTES